PNLLQLYDLVLRDGEWLLTMELVDGSDFLRHVRPLPAPLRPSKANAEHFGGGEDTLGPEHFGMPLSEADELPRAIANDNERTPPDDAASGTVSMMPVSQQLGPLDIGRLRNALRQLVEGLSALHAAGRLHRDLKPANVLVYTSDARLVIADFGLVTEVARARDDVAEHGIHGTLSYMSPEQAMGEPLTEASDWYAVGVMLYQALTGVLPFAARLSVHETIAAKRQGVLVHPCSLAREAPEDLADLAVALLDPDPHKRPRYTDVVARLDGTQKRPSLGPTAPSRLVGRNAQREQLAAAFARARGGRATVALVGGRSGMGKSALVQHFLEEMRMHHRAVVLAGRCYEREELPHKAFDPLMDALSAHLRAQSEAELRDLLPANVSSLARLFPVLRRVGLIAAALGRGEVVDPFEQKRRAFAAFRELCTNLALRQPLILFIDDLQWGDLDSAQLFGELLHGPQTPALLLVGAYRLEDADNSPLLKMLREVSFPELGVVPVEVRVDALAEGDARELALALLRGVEEPEAAAKHVASEAAGSPFLVRELSLHVRSRGAVLHGELRLDALIAERLDDLPHESRALFELIAAAGRPEKRSLLQAASKLGEQAFPALRVLEARNLVHSTGTGADDRIEAYHDRLRETAYKLLGEDPQQKLHRALAETMELSADRDPEALFEHWRRSDEPVRAGGFALEAARKAESQLAFARAAKLYEAALAQLTMDAEQRRGTEERLGHCLALAGRGMEAADAFRRAAAGAPPALAMHLRSLATTQLLRAGQFESAYRELDDAHELTGIRVPRSTASALVKLLWRRVKIRFKRIRWRRSEEAPDAHMVQRADMLWGIGAALACMDSLLGAVYQAEHLLVALRANDPYRLARAMSVEAALNATSNTNPMRSQYFLDRALEIGGISGEAHAISLIKG
ncbi:MAG TPA: AAA family ATPase, partial [Polyangiales bacterium]